MNTPKVIFETVDPLGRTVVLDSVTWNKHVLPYHNELYRQEALVQKVIEQPAFILKDKNHEGHEGRENYFELCNITHDGSLSILKVVVDYTTSTGDIVTAYTIKNTLTQATIVKGGIVYEHK
ncbi:MAG: hypothetical protein PHT78_03060 [Desulfitobacteriaceae bacterium]|nr:hypothetical protein [Desulfitobacteriaceae bacterium]MDD4752220.1 hypothetical protein [Desulfitobacteriaceae bacterium]